jgi:hypothetical protein
MNLFLLTAPYQILSALEAIHLFTFTDNHLWIIDTGHFTRKQFESVIDCEAWQSVRYYDFRYKLTHLAFDETWPRNPWERVLETYLLFDQFRKRRLAERIVRSVNNPLDNLILGNYQCNYDKHMRHFANRLRYNDLYLLDVGTDTLRISQDREIDRVSPPQSEFRGGQSLLKTVKSSIKRLLLDWDTRGAGALTFFTAYDITPSGGDLVVKNEYAYLKSVVANSDPTDTVYFVGQPLVDQCYLTLEDFSACMIQIRAHFVGQGLKYIHHPRESKRQLGVVEGLGITIHRFIAPFEHAVAFSGERPCCIASFFSSAVENCAIMFGDTVKFVAFRLPEAFLLKDHEEVARVYRHFEHNQRSRIDLVAIFAPPSASKQSGRK